MNAYRARTCKNNWEISIYSLLTLIGYLFMVFWICLIFHAFRITNESRVLLVVDVEVSLDESWCWEPLVLLFAWWSENIESLADQYYKYLVRLAHGDSIRDKYLNTASFPGDTGNTETLWPYIDDTEAPKFYQLKQE